MGHEAVRDYVESSDCLMLLGAPMNDVDLGVNTARLDPAHTIYVTSDRFTIGHHVYEDVLLADVVQGLIDAGLPPRDVADLPHPEPPRPFAAAPGRALTTERLFQALNAFLDPNTILVADVGDALFGSLDLHIAHATEYLAPAYYLSLGFSVPGAIGAQLAKPDHRILAIVGDGAFQMTGMELATAARYGLNPIVVVLNNKGYGTERPMLDGPFNDLHNWRYHRIPDVLGAGRGFLVETEDQLDQALQAAHAYTDGFSILDVQLDPHDLSGALQRLTAAMAKRVK
jgi:indolepyruvate decarboxylase